MHLILVIVRTSDCLSVKRTDMIGNGVVASVSRMGGLLVMATLPPRGSGRHDAQIFFEFKFGEIKEVMLTAKSGWSRG